MPNTLGLDLGTSSLKALIIGEDGAPIAVASAPLTVERPDFGWSEQDPATWLAACSTVMAELKAGHGDALAAVVGIGLSGQMHGATLLGAGDEVLRPCMLWNDSRSHAEAFELDDDEARAITGNIVFPGFTAPKLLWVRRHEPAIFEKVRRVLLPKDFLRLFLTGEAVSDMSDAAGTSWLDTGRRDWSDTMLARTGLSRAHMPSLVEGSAPSGGLRRERAEAWGMRPGTVVAGGGGDNAASACGVGVAAPGTGFLSLGTSGVLFTAAERYAPRPETALHTFCHAIPGTWHHMGVALSAAGSLQWLSGVLAENPSDLIGALGEGKGEGEGEGEGEGGPGRLLFLPYLSGERTPHNDSAIRGAFVGLDAATDRAAMTRAVLEGVAFAMRDCLEAGEGKGSIARLVAVGAGSRSSAWLRTMATVLGAEIVLPAAGDFGAALGAARLGLCAATGAEPADVMREPPIARTFRPDAALAAAYEDAYGRYRRLYPALRDA